MKNKPPFIKQIIEAIGLMFGVFAVTTLAQTSWVSPQLSPPNCLPGEQSCYAPINAIHNSQSKLGQLLINTQDISGAHPYVIGLQSFGKSVFDSIQINGGAGDGKILMSDAVGNASWQSPNTDAIISSVTYGSVSAYDSTAPGGDITQTGQISLGSHAFCALGGETASGDVRSYNPDGDVIPGIYWYFPDPAYVYKSSSNDTWFVNASYPNHYRQISCFDIAQPTPVSVTITITGKGKVDWTVNGSSCSSTSGNSTICVFPNSAVPVSPPITVSLQETPNALSSFIGWGDSCATFGSGNTCNIILTTTSGNVNVTAKFSP